MAKTTDTRYFGDPKGAKARRKLYGEIERLEGRLRLERELVDLKEKQLRLRREAALDKEERQLKRAQYPQEMALASPEAAAAEQLRDQLPALARKQRLAFRKQRQDLRRAEGLLDPQGRLLPDRQLSSKAQAQLDDLLKQQQVEQDNLYASLLSQAKASRLSPAEQQARAAAYEQAMLDKDRRMAQLKAQLEAADKGKMDAFTARQQPKIDQQTALLKQKQAALLQSDQHASHNLPEDVVLRLDGLSMQFGGLKAVDDLSFDVRKGEIFGLIGPNGAGKTTVFNCITQFYKPTAGNILYRTHEGNVLRLNNYQVHEIITKGIVRTFQNVEVIAELSILENLLIAAHKQYGSNLFLQMFNTRKVRQEEQVIRERALKVLDYCGLTALKDLPPVGQPYGVLKRIELARTLMAGAHLIILDEPAAGLNDQETVELTHLIRRIQKDYQATIFLVEHDMGLVMDLCDHICAISFGRKLAYGTPQEIQQDKAVQEAYLGTHEAPAATEEVHA